MPNLPNYKCKYCNTDFSSKSYLTYHQKNARYCLKIQGNSDECKFKCDYCDKILSSEKRLKTHYEICKEFSKDKLEDRYKEKLAELKLQLSEQRLTYEAQKTNYENTIKELQNKLENIAIKAVQKSTTTIKNTQINYIQKMEPITKEHLVNHVPQLTIEHIKKGASGYAEYALGGPLKDRIACVDYSRRKIKFKDIEGNIITDPEMTKLAPMFFDSIKDKSSQLVYDLNTADMDSSMFERIAKLFNTNADVKNGAIGVKTDFYHDFIKQVCSGSVVDN